MRRAERLCVSAVTQTSVKLRFFLQKILMQTAVGMLSSRMQKKKRIYSFHLELMWIWLPCAIWPRMNTALCMTVLSARMLIWKTDMCEPLLKQANPKSSARFWSIFPVTAITATHTRELHTMTVTIRNLKIQILNRFIRELSPVPTVFLFHTT